MGFGKHDTMQPHASFKQSYVEMTFISHSFAVIFRKLLSMNEGI